MAVKDVFKVSRKTFFDPTRWIDAAGIKSSSTILWSSAKAVFFSSPLDAGRKETFNEAAERLGLTEDYIKDLTSYYLWFAVLFVFLGFGLICLATYFWINGLLADGIIAFSIAIFLFGQGYTFDFWRFQVKNRRLGCTFEEWRHGKLKSGGTNE